MVMTYNRSNGFKFDQFIKIPTGKIGFANVNDTISPKVVGFDLYGNEVWVVELIQDTICDIPIKMMSNIRLNIDNKNEPYISFYNDSFGEPGKIYLTKNFEFDYLCFSPM